MYAVERLSSYITRGVYTVSGPFHPFGGAVDIIVVQQQDGSFKSSPWNVRFGKFQGVLKTREKIVKICVNGTDAEFHMYLDHKGEAYFLKDASQDEGEMLMLSPPSSGDETDALMKNARLRKAQSCNFEESFTEPVVGHLNVENDKTVARMDSRPPRIFGFVFGRRTVEASSNGVNVERISSLERAEIAADLLEVKWSTNLTTNGQTGTSCLKTPSNVDGGGNVADGEQRVAIQSPDSGSAYDTMITAQQEQIDGNTECRSEEHLLEPVFSGCSELKTFEEVIEICSSEAGRLTPDNEVRLSSPKSVDFDVSFEQSVSVKRTIDLCSSNLHKLSDEKDCLLADGTYGEDFGDREVSSCLSCERSESPNLMHDVSACTTTEVLNFLLEESGEVATGHLKQTTQQQCEKLHEHEPRPSDVRETSDRYCGKSLELNNDKDPALSAHAIAEACEKPVGGYLPTESLSSLDLSLSSSESIETRTVNVTQGYVLEEETAGVKVTNMLEISKHLHEMDGSCAEPDWNTLGLNVDQELSSSEERRTCSSYVPRETFSIGDKIQEWHNPIESVQLDEKDFPVEDTITAKLDSDLHTSEVANAVFYLPDRSEEDQFLFNEIHERHNPLEGVHLDENTFPVEDAITSKLDSDLHMSEVANNAFCLPDRSEEDQFLFNEIHSIASNVHPAWPAPSGALEAEDSPCVLPDDDLQEHESADMNLDVHDADISALPRTSPISIPKLKSCPEEKRLCLGSLPNIRSDIHDLERSSIHPTSYSLHINSNMSMLGIPEEDISSFPNIDSGYESNLLPPQSMCSNLSVVGVAQTREEENGITISPTVEMSLCRPLLSEGMDAEAASKAFDAEKEGIFDASGMISVDKPDKIPERDISRAVVPSGGAWRLWPFNFNKTRSMNPHLEPNVVGGIDKGATAVSVDCKMGSENNVEKSWAMKKKVRSVVPTSEQLASLKLKEGQNLVTFSFSTAMLGRQQVDARIYLWKWNTRIVVSDVDGTITRSDVLGQFMPLVGKDWSQTGVAHFFSAIKENGYQFLFLSARAISQAYLTRQFLFNIKQDGKVLPDGPVVISPDGLFPSLYREVIRRAPHEFKISCLEDIRALFPLECNPFYAGFGNRNTDEISYLKVGIPKGKIFIINPKGEVAVNRRVDTKSYTSLHALVDAIFPVTQSAEQEDFNSWNYWKVPLHDIDT